MSSTLKLFRRHKKSCAHRGGGAYTEIREGVEKAACRCPIWCAGSIGGREVRRSIRETSWKASTKWLVEQEEAGRIIDDDSPGKLDATIERVKEEFLTDLEHGRKLKKSSVDRHRFLLRALIKFAAGACIRLIRELDTPALNKFRATWRGESGLASAKKLERLKHFLKFAVANGYLATNPAASIAPPKIRQNPTLPFTAEELTAVLLAADAKIAASTGLTAVKAQRVRALVLFLRYTGLRISDAIGCPCDLLTDGKLFLYTAKTGQAVYCPLPAFLVKELDLLPRASDGFWFRSGSGSLETARKKCSEALAHLFKAAKVKEGHAHRLRDTFAVELLKSGTPIERVSIFLGHSSTRITEKHYSPWNLARQQQAELDVARSWTNDPLVLLEKCTPGVREPS